MVDDLLKKHPLVGSSVEELVQWIGKPNEQYTHTLVYYLGEKPGGFIPPSVFLSLTIREDTVVKYDILYD